MTLFQIATPLTPMALGGSKQVTRSGNLSASCHVAPHHGSAFCFCWKPCVTTDLQVCDGKEVVEWDDSDQVNNIVFC